MSEFYSMKKLICQISIRQAKCYAKLLPDKENCMPKFFQAEKPMCHFPAKEKYMQEYFRTLKLICQMKCGRRNYFQNSSR